MDLLVHAPEVVDDTLLLRAATHNVVVELAPATIALRVDEDDVVAAVVVARVYEDGVQDVRGKIVLGCRGWRAPLIGRSRPAALFVIHIHGLVGGGGTVAGGLAIGGAAAETEKKC